MTDSAVEKCLRSSSVAVRIDLIRVPTDIGASPLARKWYGPSYEAERAKVRGPKSRERGYGGDS